MATIVDSLYADFSAIFQQIDASEVSLQITAKENFRKSLLLAAASLFETQIISCIKEEATEAISSHEPLRELLFNKSLNRQYHTFFDWDKNNGNNFYGLFGSGFKEFMVNKVKSDPSLKDSVSAFLEIGRERNRLVHQNFGAFALEKSDKEIYETYQKALPFVQGIRKCFTEFLAESVMNDSEA